jgi:hypothetical protein
MISIITRQFGTILLFDMKIVEGMTDKTLVY